MALLLDLVKGTTKVLDTMVKNSNQSSLSINTLRRVNMRGVYSKIIDATVKGTKGNIYKCNITFLGLKNPHRNKPSFSGNRVLVRCSCPSYYFWCLVANIKAKCNIGSQFKQYIRKTPVTDPRYPPKNPNHIPCMCKHVLFLANHLKSRGQLLP